MHTKQELMLEDCLPTSHNLLMNVGIFLTIIAVLVFITLNSWPHWVCLFSSGAVIGLIGFTAGSITRRWPSYRPRNIRGFDLILWLNENDELAHKFVPRGTHKPNNQLALILPLGGWCRSKWQPPSCTKPGLLREIDDWRFLFCDDSLTSPFVKVINGKGEVSSILAERLLRFIPLMSDPMISRGLSDNWLETTIFLISGLIQSLETNHYAINELRSTSRFGKSQAAEELRKDLENRQDKNPANQLS